MKKSKSTGGNVPKHKEGSFLMHPQKTTRSTDEELLAMQPAPDASPEAWRAYHQLLVEAGKLKPFAR